MTKIKDICDYKFISGLVFSPIGKNAGFIVHKADYEGNKYISDIWVMDKATESYKQLTAFRDVKKFSWLDDDTILVQRGELWTVNLKGETSEFYNIPVKVTDIKPVAGSIYALTAMYSHYEEEEDYIIIDELPFYLDGAGFTNKKRNRLYLFDKANGNLTSITGEFTNVSSFVINNGRILYTAKTFTDFHDNFEMGLYLYDTVAEKSTQLLEENHVITYADFIKDEIFIVGGLRKNMLVTDNPKFYFVRNGKIEIWHNTDFSVKDTVISDCRYGDSPGFKVHKDCLYLVSTFERSSFLTKVPFEGEIQFLTTDNGSVDGFDFSGDEIYYIGLRGTKLQEIYLNDRQITNINKAVENISVPEVMQFENNGFNVHYVILKPVNFDENKKYPAILYIHGGAKIIYGPVFFHEMQLLASNGYFVVYGNPRGSDGQGSEFARLIGNYGTPDYQDMMKAMDVALERYPQIDETRLGVAGGSYGGIMTNWIIGHTNRFKCAIAQRSICNMVSTIGTADNGTNFVREQMDGDIWENIDKIWAQSPLKYAHRVRTPLLLLHSDEDYRCHYTEAFQMFSALKFHGVDSRICLIKGENHNLSREGRPKARIKRLTEILDWFNKYLGGGSQNA